MTVEAHICAAAMKVFGMSSVNDTPTDALFPEGCTQFNPAQRWNVIKLAVRRIIDEYVISYPMPSTKKDNDHVRAYAKELTSFGSSADGWCV